MNQWLAALLGGIALVSLFAPLWVFSRDADRTSETNRRLAPVDQLLPTSAEGWHVLPSEPSRVNEYFTCEAIKSGTTRQLLNAFTAHMQNGTSLRSTAAEPVAAQWRYAESFFANGTQGRCLHVGAVPVEDLYGEVVAALCPTCNEQLGTNWRVG